MATLICPQCGTENSTNAANCKQCRINLKFALEHPEALAQADQKDLAIQSSQLTSDLQQHGVGAKEELRATTLPPNLLRAQKRAVLAWAIALPLGWFLGYVIGAAIAYNSYIPPKALAPNSIQGMREHAAMSGGSLGGTVGILIGWIIACVVTLLALRSVIPALRPSQIVWATLWATLPFLILLMIGNY